ncbi:MAG: sulfotransferase [Acidimicrobiales bacterium]
MSTAVKSAPVFISGHARSGTTLLGNLIDRHPSFAIFLESFFIPRYAVTQRLYSPLHKRENLEALARSITSQRSSIDNGLQFTPDLLDILPEPTYPHLIDAMMSNWAKNQSKKRWGDKSPGYITKFSVLKELFPNAKFVHIIRDGRDVCLSLQALGWESNPVRVAKAWSKTVGGASLYGRQNLGDDYLEINYERLIADPANELETIMGFLGESFFESQLSNQPVVSNNNAFAPWPGVNQSVKASNAEKWRSAMPPKDLQLFNLVAGDALRQLGYPVESTSTLRLRAEAAVRGAIGDVETGIRKSREASSVLVREARLRTRRR